MGRALRFSIQHEEHIAAGSKALTDLRLQSWRVMEDCRRCMESCYVRSQFEYSDLLPRDGCGSTDHEQGRARREAASKGFGVRRDADCLRDLRGQTSGSHQCGEHGQTQRCIGYCAKVAVCLRIADDDVVLFRGLQDGLAEAIQARPDGLDVNKLAGKAGFGEKLRDIRLSGRASACQMSVSSRGTPCTKRQPPTVVRPWEGRAGVIRIDSLSFAGFMERRARSSAATHPLHCPAVLNRSF